MLGRIPTSFREERFRGDNVRRADHVRWDIVLSYGDRAKSKEISAE